MSKRPRTPDTVVTEGNVELHLVRPASGRNDLPADATDAISPSAFPLLSPTTGAFFNPAQIVNRDISMAAARVFVDQAVEAQADRQFVIVDALAASGARALRYGAAMPRQSIDKIIVNDVDVEALELARHNIAVNGQRGVVVPEQFEVSANDAINMLHGTPADIIDVDPYGTATPFLIPALQSILRRVRHSESGGLLAVTCTDMQVLCGNNAEASMTRYHGVPVKSAVMCHELALRMVLNTLIHAASLVGAHVTPLLSLSVDFYVRLFVRVTRSPSGLQKNSCARACACLCVQCGSVTTQPFTDTLPPTANYQGKGPGDRTVPARTKLSSTCFECGGAQRMLGPFYGGELHDATFVSRLQAHLEANEPGYGAHERIAGLVANAAEELPTALFYHRPASHAKAVKAPSPRSSIIRAALYLAGYESSRTHASPTAIKTTAPSSVLYDVYIGLARCDGKFVGVDESPVATDGPRLGPFLENRELSVPDRIASVRRTRVWKVTFDRDALTITVVNEVTGSRRVARLRSKKSDRFEVLEGADELTGVRTPYEVSGSADVEVRFPRKTDGWGPAKRKK